ncbi:hypothetical protein NDU88_003034 [Pleurodeles waltl]|uniref:Uncharacterized protein n=1 Tax=Pleurodeles waltl TaxID=8319 RepID=A0AAV7W3K5_PLEWA|nr:hypothetical protein NDU88_003034 [Pleurodeles waltl]
MVRPALRSHVGIVLIDGLLVPGLCGRAPSEGCFAMPWPFGAGSHPFAEAADRGVPREVGLPLIGCFPMAVSMFLTVSWATYRDASSLGTSGGLQCGEPQQSFKLHDQVRKALSKRVEKNDKMSRKCRAKERNILVGDHVLVRNRGSGSKFLVPFEKEPWVVSAIKGTMVTAKTNQETITRNISFFKTFRKACGEMEMDQVVPLGRLNEDDDDRSVDSWDRRSPLQSSGMVVGESLLAGRECVDGQGSEVIQSSDQDLAESLAVGSLPPGQELEHYHLLPRPTRSTCLKGFVAD